MDRFTAVAAAVMVAVFALAMRAGTINLGGIVEHLAAEPLLAINPSHPLAFAAFLIRMLAETGRPPVDNPATHLELTMIHEAMVLEYAGADLALVQLGESMRLALLLGLFSNLLVPWGVATRPGALWFLLGALTLTAKVAVLGAGVSVFEVFSAKLRLFRLPELLAGSFLLAVLAVIPPQPVWQIAAFFVFRAFDVVKPPPIRYFERRLKGGFGVMFDDVLAAGYTPVVLAIAHRLLA